MVLSWALMEIVRYALRLLNTTPAALRWLRYTTFFVLYPTGAGSEAFLAALTLPRGGWPWMWIDIARGMLLLVWPPCASAFFFLDFCEVADDTDSIVCAL